MKTLVLLNFKIYSQVSVNGQQIHLSSPQYAARGLPSSKGLIQLALCLSPIKLLLVFFASPCSKSLLCVCTKS